MALPEGFLQGIAPFLVAVALFLAGVCFYALLWYIQRGRGDDQR